METTQIRKGITRKGNTAQDNLGNTTGFETRWGHR